MPQASSSLPQVFETEFVAEQIRQLGQFMRTAAVGVLVARARASWHESADGPGSPLEASFALWWQVYGVLAPNLHLALVPQHEVNTGEAKYRLDFRVRLTRIAMAALDVSADTIPDEPLVGVELDGHAFHERTKQQATERNRRDRDLSALGWRILHFSGSEFYHAPMHCVADVAEAAICAYSEWENHIDRARMANGLGPT